MPGPSASPPSAPARHGHLPYGLITGLLLIVTFYFGKPVLMPLALAGLFAFLLNPVVNLLSRGRLPRAVAVLVVTLSVFTLLGVTGWVIGREFTSLASSLPGYKDNIRSRVASFHEGSRGGVMDQLKEIKTTIEESTEAAAKSGMPGGGAAPPSAAPFGLAEPVPATPPAASEAAPSNSLAEILGSAGEGLGTVATVIVFVIFMLLRQQELRNRLMRLAGFRHVTVVTRATDETGGRVGRYLLMQALINSSYGIVLATGLYFIGLPYVVLWGMLAALFRFIPYLGPVAVAVLPSALSLAHFNDWQHPLMVMALIASLELITNLLVEPVVYGNSVGVSEFALLVAIVFWTWMWGGIGLMMATPLTVCLVVMAKHVPSLEWVEILMGDDPKFKSHMVLYQRLLAEDEAEAEDYIKHLLKEKPAMEVMDEAVLPALALAKRELNNGLLSVEEEHRLHDSVLRVISGALPTAPPPDRGAPLILGRPLEEGADEAALRCFDQMLATGFNFEVIPALRLSSEFHAEVEARAPAAVLLSATPPGSHGTSRIQIRRLRQQFPKLKIYIGRWGVPDEVAHAAPLLQAGATAVFTRLAEAQAALTLLVREAAAVSETAGRQV